MKDRLHKVLARCGVASRRGAERLIEEGRVSVNGAVVTRLGSQVDPEHDAVKLDGKRVELRPERAIYVMLNKPRGYVTTMSDPEGRPCVADLVRRGRGRVFPVGRLDFNSEGLLILTNDGELAQALMHPSRGVEKTYLAKVRGRPEETRLRRLTSGVEIEGRRSRALRVRIVRPEPNSWLELTVVEGRKHLVRKMLAAVGHPVVKLRRIRYAGLTLGALPSGESRRLSEEELGRLRQATGASRPGRQATASRRN